LAAGNSNQVIVLDNLRRGRLKNLAASLSRITFVEGDIRDRAKLEAVTRNVDTIYHLAAQSTVMGAVSDTDYSFTTNVTGTYEVLRAAREMGVQKLIFTSSREVYGDQDRFPVSETAQLKPKNHYGVSKLAGELYCQVLSSGCFQARVLRLANVYGSRDFDRVIPTYANQAFQGEPLTLYGGDQLIDFIHIDHVVEALIRAATRDSMLSPVNVGTGRPTDLRTLASKIISLTRSTSKLVIERSRAIEVAKFMADTRLQKECLGMESPVDPLKHLPDVVQSLELR